MQICDRVKLLCVDGPMPQSHVDVSQFGRVRWEFQAKKSILRIKTIKQMEELHAANPYYQNKAEIYFRLAEAYWEENHYHYLIALKQWIGGRMRNGKRLRSELLTEPEPDYSRSLEYNRKILREQPGYQRIDEVLYYLGHGALEVGRRSRDPQMQLEGLEHLDNLVMNHPQCRLIPQALLQQAEYYFEMQSFDLAKRKYQDIIMKYPESGMINYVRYKLAWAYYNLTEFEKSVEVFQMVVEATKPGKREAKTAFHRQALNDLVLVYTEVEEGWKLALEYFTEETGSDDAQRKIQMMGKIYHAQGKVDEETAVSSALSRLSP